MKIESIAGWLGEYELIIKKSNKVIEKVVLKPNLLTDVALNMMRDLLNGAVTDGEIKYVALGNSNTDPAHAQTALVSEQFRKQVTSQTSMPGVGTLETIGYISENEANSFKTEEIGWFAGTSASATVSSGLMIARILFSRQKNDLETWTIRRIDTIKRA